MLTACLPGLSRWQLQEETLQVPENQGVTSPVTKGLGPPPPRYLIPSDLVVFPPPPHHFLHRPGPQLLTQQSCNAGTTLHTCSSSPICLACPISRAPTADDLFKQREKALFLERQGAENIIKKKKKSIYCRNLHKRSVTFHQDQPFTCSDEDDVPPVQKRFFYPCPARITRYLCQSAGTTPPKAMNKLLSLLNRAAVFLVHRGRAHAPVTELSKSHILY